MIYIVTTIRPASAGDRRPVGYFETIAEAEQCVIENMGDIHEEGHYPEAVIEGFEPGLYPDVHEERWYAWNTEVEGYQRVDKPAEHQRISNFGLG